MSSAIGILGSLFDSINFTWITDIKRFFSNFLIDVANLWNLVPGNVRGLITVVISIMIIVAILKTLKDVIPFV